MIINFFLQAFGYNFEYVIVQKIEKKVSKGIKILNFQI